MLHLLGKSEPFSLVRTKFRDIVAYGWCKSFCHRLKCLAAIPAQVPKKGSLELLFTYCMTAEI